MEVARYDKCSSRTKLQLQTETYKVDNSFIWRRIHFQVKSYTDTYNKHKLYIFECGVTKILSPESVTFKI